MKLKDPHNLLLCIPAIVCSILLSVCSIINIVVLSNMNWSVRSYLLGFVIIITIFSLLQFLFINISVLVKQKNFIKNLKVLILGYVTLLSSFLIIADYFIYDNWYQHNGYAPIKNCSIMPTSIILNTIVLASLIFEIIWFFALLLENKKTKKSL